MLNNKYPSLDRRELKVNIKWFLEIQWDSEHPGIQQREERQWVTTKGREAMGDNKGRRDSG